MKDPIRPTDQDALDTAAALVKGARFAALGTIDPQGHPHVTRVAVSWIDGPVTLISDLSDHTKHLRADPRASLLLGEPGEKGDPLTHPRITLIAKAAFIDRSVQDAWVARHPKSKLYVDFTDFNFVRLNVASAHLNGGFGKAYRLTAQELGL
ncbi:MAG: pyridoxamine 5'-phosphate oxidase family protein [Pseudomonadota bacterium]